MNQTSGTDSAEASGGSVAITVEADGPLAVAGSVQIVASDGSILETTERTWLCRCGQSAKKPFCDGSHRKVGFTDSGRGPAQ